MLKNGLRTLRWPSAWSGERLADERGNIAIMAAVIALPLVFIAFGAVEYHRVTMVRNQLQHALDSATLAVALSPETDEAKLQLLGATVLTTNLPNNGGQTTLSALTFTESEGDVTGAATITIKPIIAHMLWTPEINVSGLSTVARLGSRIELALVLDNTYSMLTNDRIGILKQAATEFVDTLSASAVKTKVADALKIGVVPFSTTVNVGSVNTSGAARDKLNSPWLDWDAASPIHREPFNAPVKPSTTPAANRFDFFVKLGQPWAGCVETRPMPYDVQDDPPSGAKPATLFVPYFSPDEPDSPDWGASYFINNYIPDATSSSDYWVKEKNVEKYNVSPTPTVKKDLMGSGYQYGPNFNCPRVRPVVPLTTDVTKVKTALSALTVSGDTNIPVGMAWGWHTLSPQSPFAEKGAAYGPGVAKIAVLMTDGDNSNVNNSTKNQSIYSGIGFIWQNRLGITSGTAAERKAKMDERLALLCKNMKAAGVVIYTIRLEQTGDGTLMQNCASDPAKYYDVKAAAELTTAFKAIADSIVNVRVRN